MQWTEAFLVILRQYLYVGAPLIYMLVTYRRTYCRELQIRDSESEANAQVSDSSIIQKLY